MCLLNLAPDCRRRRSGTSPLTPFPTLAAWSRDRPCSTSHLPDTSTIFSSLLLSGGASALMALPAEGISLQDKRRASARLLKEGAEVHALNTVRKHLSAIKGGQLAAVARGAVLTLAVSDVVGDDLSAIGSGPTVADTTTFGDALGILDQHGGRDQYPAAVVARLMNGAAGGVAETPKPGDSRLARSTSFVIGGSRTAVDGARAAAERRGYNVHVIDAPLVGEARQAAQELLETASRVLRGRAGPQCILAAGETTVRVSGSGKGGRNQECALAMAEGVGRLASAVVAASVGTDGVDGPTDAAGGDRRLDDAGTCGNPGHRHSNEVSRRQQQLCVLRGAGRSDPHRSH